MNNIYWFGSLCTSFEAAFHEVDDFMSQPKEELEYARNQIQRMGASIEHVCTDFVQEVFFQSSVGEVEGTSHDSSSTQTPDDADKMLKENREIDVANHSEEKQLQLKATPYVKYRSLLEVTPTFDDLENSSCEKITPIGISCSNPFDSVHFSKSEVLDIFSWRSAYKTEPGKSSIIFDSSSEYSSESDQVADSGELSSNSDEAEQHGSYKKKFREAIATRRRASRHDESHRSQDLEPCQQEKDFESFAFTSLDHEFSDSEWEII